MGMDLRIPSFDDSGPNVTRSGSQKSTTSNSEAENYEKQSSDWSGNENRSRYYF